jgi:DNA uptake protein ComE-like DNA-binding protein
MKKLLGVIFVAAFLIFVARAATFAQVGKGVTDANIATEAELTAAPHITPAIAKALIAKRTEKFFGSITELNAFLLNSGLTQPQAMETYSKIFIHVNLNTGTREEILLIPNAGNRMVREFAEYRPWTSWAQFDKEIGKYVQAEGVAKLKPYVFIPIDLNKATDEDILTIPGAGNRMVREFKEYRPWTSKAQFDKEIGKYVKEKETERLWRFVVIK